MSPDGVRLPEAGAPQSVTYANAIYGWSSVLVSLTALETQRSYRLGNLDRIFLVGISAPPTPSRRRLIERLKQYPSQVPNAA
jgi:hypothetical protein